MDGQLISDTASSTASILFIIGILVIIFFAIKNMEVGGNEDKW